MERITRFMSKNHKPVIMTMEEFELRRRCKHRAWQDATRKLEVGQGIEGTRCQMLSCWRTAKRLGFTMQFRTVDRKKDIAQLRRVS